MWRKGNKSKERITVNPTDNKINKLNKRAMNEIK
jgi:hypothetical protein